MKIEYHSNFFLFFYYSYLGGIGYILIYGTLFWKSYRIVRIFDVSSQCKNLNSSAFVLLVLGLCCIQVIMHAYTYIKDVQ